MLELKNLNFAISKALQTENYNLVRRMERLASAGKIEFDESIRIHVPIRQKFFMTEFERSCFLHTVSTMTTRYEQYFPYREYLTMGDRTVQCIRYSASEEVIPRASGVENVFSALEQCQTIVYKHQNDIIGYKATSDDSLQKLHDYLNKNDIKFTTSDTLSRVERPEWMQILRSLDNEAYNVLRDKCRAFVWSDWLTKLLYEELSVAIKCTAHDFVMTDIQRSAIENLVRLGRFIIEGEEINDKQ